MFDSKCVFCCRIAFRNLAYPNPWVGTFLSFGEGYDHILGRLSTPQSSHLRSWGSGINSNSLRLSWCGCCGSCICRWRWRRWHLVIIFDFLGKRMWNVSEQELRHGEEQCIRAPWLSKLLAFRKSMLRVIIILMVPSFNWFSRWLARLGGSCARWFHTGCSIPNLRNLFGWRSHSFPLALALLFAK